MNRYGAGLHLRPSTLRVGVRDAALEYPPLCTLLLHVLESGEWCLGFRFDRDFRVDPSSGPSEGVGARAWIWIVRLTRLPLRELLLHILHTRFRVEG